MSARDAFLDAVAGEVNDAMEKWDTGRAIDTPHSMATHVALRLEKVGALRKTHTITTAKELDALPVGSVIRTSGTDLHAMPRVAVKTGYWLKESEWEVADSTEWIADSSELDDLPAVVLYEPTT